MDGYAVYRLLEDGGSVAVGLNPSGVIYYTDKADERVLFVRERDAMAFTEYCKGNMPTYRGQKDAWFARKV